MGEEVLIEWARGHVAGNGWEWVRQDPWVYVTPSGAVLPASS